MTKNIMFQASFSQTSCFSHLDLTENCAIDNAISVMHCWQWCQWHHMTKGHVTPYFSCLHNKVMPLMVQLASHYTNAVTSDSM